MPGPTFDLPVGTADPNISALRRHIRGATAFPDSTTTGMILVSNGDAPPSWQPTGTAPPNAHVLATTTGLGPQHTVSGLTAGQVLRATGAAAAQFMRAGAADVDPGTFPAGTFSMTTLNLQTLVIGTDPTGAEPLRVGGGARFNGAVTVLTGGITVTGNSTLAGTLGGITTLTATTLAGTLSTAAQPNVTSLGTLTSLTMGGTLTMGANTLALASATVSGAPTWSSNQAITLSTAAQPNVTSLGTLTGLTVSGSTSLQALTATTGNFSSDLTLQARLLFSAATSKVIPGATSMSLRNNADSADNLLLSDAGIATLRNDLTVSTLGTFDSTGTRFGGIGGTTTTYDVLSFDGAVSKWRPRLLQTSWTAGVVTNQANTDGTFAGFAFSVTYNNATPAVPATPVVTPIYGGFIIDMGATPPSGSSYVVDYSRNGGAFTSGAIIFTSQKAVHTIFTNNGGLPSGFAVTDTFSYKAKGRGKADGTFDSAYSAASTAVAPKTTTEINAFGLVVASQISAIYLSSIVANMGLITAGQIRNTSKTGVIQLDTTFALDAAAVNGIFFAGANPIPAQITGLGLDFTATGTNPILKASKLKLNADGSAQFGGKIDITNPDIVPGTFATEGWMLLRSTTLGILGHGVTTHMPTDCAAMAVLYQDLGQSTVGGLYIEGIVRATGSALGLSGIKTASGTASGAVVNIIGSLANGTGTQAVVDADPLVGIQNNTTVLLTLFGKGDLLLKKAGGATVDNRLGGVLKAEANVDNQNSGTTETDLKSYTVLANTLDAQYRAVRFEFWGTHASNANTKTVRLYYGGTLVLTMATTFGSNDWFVRGVIHYTGASAQEIWAVGFISNLTGTAGTPATTMAGNSFAKSNAADQILKITGQGGATGDVHAFTFDVWYTP